MEQIGVEGIFLTDDYEKGIKTYNAGLKLSEKETQAWARITEQAMKQAEAEVKKLSQAYTRDYVSGLQRGTVSTNQFQSALIASAQEMGLSTSEIKTLATASGLYTTEQLKAAQASRNLAMKADELNRAVAAGTMSADQAGKEFADYARTQEVTAKANEKTANSFKGLKSALVGVVSVAAITATVKKAYDWGKEGAVAIQTEASFRNLLKTIGAAPDLLNQLRAAANGTVDDLSLMSATATLLAGTTGELSIQMAKATPDLLEIAKAANKLNPSLGTTTFLYESIATGIKRASPMILDNLGIVLKVGDAYDKFAASLGKKADQLTKDEQAQALLNATLEKGKVLIAQAGGAADSATDGFLRLEAQTKNLTDAFKAYVAEGIIPALQPISDYLIDSLAFGKVQDRLNQALKDGTITQSEYSKVIEDLRWRKIEDADATEWLTSREKLAAGAVDTAVGSYDDYVKALTDSYKASGANTRMLTTWERALARGDVSVEKYAQALGGLSEASFEQAKRFEELKKSTVNIPPSMRNAATSITEVGDAALDAAAKEKALSDEQARLSQAMSDLQFTVSGKLGPSLEDYREKQRSLNQEALTLRNTITQLEGMPVTKARTEELEANRQKLVEIEAQIKKNADEHEIATKRILFDLLAQRAAMDGLTTDELSMITTIAQKWGLIDEASARAMSAADQAFLDLAGGAGLNETIAKFEHATGLIDTMSSELRGMNGKTFTVDVLVNTNYHGNPYVPGGGTTTVTEKTKTGGRPPERGGAKGLNFVVPPGYPNDSYRFRATSGEQVLIIPKPQTRSTAPVNFSPSMASQPVSPSYNNTANVSMGGVNIYNQMGSAQLESMIRNIFRQQMIGA